MSQASNGARIVRCPGCGGPSVYALENVHRPFCSARCKNNDFGAWASEGYSVPVDADLPPPDIDLDTDRGDTQPH